MSEVPLYVINKRCYDPCPRLSVCTGVPRSSETASPWDPAVGPCLGLYGDLGGAVFSNERGTLVLANNPRMPATHTAFAAPGVHG